MEDSDRTGKPPSEFFYKLRRASLAASMLLIFMHVVGIGGADHAQFLIFTIKPIPDYLIPLMVEIVSLYFFAYFLVVYFNETPSFLLSSNGIMALDRKISDIKQIKAELVGQGDLLNKTVVSLQKVISEHTSSLEALKVGSTIPINLSTPSFNDLHTDAFNAISSAIRLAATDARSKGLPESEIRKHVRWEDLSNKIVEVMRDRVESGLISRAVMTELSRRDASDRKVIETENIRTEIDSVKEQVSADYSRVAKQFGLLALLFSSWKASWFVRLRLFDAFIPVAAFIASQVVFAYQLFR
jgi:hypothetical protein